MTLSANQRMHIRRLFFAEHWKVGTIATQLGVHPDAVKAALETNTFVSRGPRRRTNLLEPYADFIHRTLEQFPRLRSTRLYDMLVERGYEGSHGTPPGAEHFVERAIMSTLSTEWQG